MKNKLKSRERVLIALKRQEPDKVPWVESYMHDPLAEDILGHKIKKRENVRLGPEIVEKLNLDNLTYAFRPPEYAEKHEKNGISFVGKGLIKTKDDLKKINLPDPKDKKFYKPLKKFISENKKDYAFMLSMRLGLANAYISIGLENFSINLYDDPEFVLEVMDLYTNWSKRALDVVQDFDIDLILMADDIASKHGPLFSPKMISELFMPKLKKVAKNIKIPWIYHSDGNYEPILDDLLELGMDGIANLEPGPMNLAELKKNYGDKVALMGNIDLHHTLTRGTPEETRLEAIKRINEAGKGGGYLLASSNGLAHYCKKENVLALNEIVGKAYYPITL